MQDTHGVTELHAGGVVGKPYLSRSVNSDQGIFTYEFVKGLVLLKILETNAEQII